MKRKMSDITNTESQRIINENIPPYKYNSRDYTSIDLDVLNEFMHAEFPHVSHGGPRDKGIVVENPPANICSPEEWEKIIKTILPPEWDSLEPRLRRSCKIIVRFVDKLCDNKKDIRFLGNSLDVKVNGKDENWIRLATKNLDGNILDKESIAFMLMHELAESDFWAKTKKDDKTANISKEDDENALISPHKYINLLDEKIANRRALRAIIRMWPDLTWKVPEKHIYEEDKIGGHHNNVLKKVNKTR